MRWDHKLAPYDNAGLVITRACQVMLSASRKGPAYLAMPRESAMHPGTAVHFPLQSHLPAARPPVADRADLRQAAQWLLGPRTR